jgi:hypothetical protein
MGKALKHMTLDRKGDVFCIHLNSHRMQEADILEMADEAVDLIHNQGCRKMALSLGPGELECLYSVFLAKLVMIRRNLAEHGGRLKIFDATSDTLGVFEACHLRDYFDFVPDEATAMDQFAKLDQGGPSL